MKPDSLGDKFCRLDINMNVDGRVVDLEVQVQDERDYPERSLYYWAREYSSALPEGNKYVDLPPVIIISIVAFPLFDCADYHSEFRPLEVTRHELLTDRMVMHYFELSKLPEEISPDDITALWLSLFRSETDEDVLKIQKMGGPVMEQMVEAYRRVSVSDEFREVERLRERARHNEAAALFNAERRGIEKGREEGREKGMLDVAKKMKDKGKSINEIAEMTDLSVDDVLRL